MMFLKAVAEGTGQKDCAVQGELTSKIATSACQQTLKADWIQLPVERYLAALPTLKQGVRAESVQDQKCLSLGYYQGREVAGVGVPSQRPVFG